MAEVLAELRGRPVGEIAAATTANARALLRFP
jgi:Tat protein secretion system quality control protein TatD with DNase activity